MMNFRSITSDFHRKSEVALLIFSISNQIIWIKKIIFFAGFFCRYLTYLASIPVFIGAAASEVWARDLTSNLTSNLTSILDLNLTKQNLNPAIC